MKKNEKLLELIANTKIKIIIYIKIMYHYMICCKLKLIHMVIINYKFIDNIRKF